MGASSLPGYTVLKKASEQLAEREQSIPSNFEVFDLKTFQKTEIDNTRASKKKRAKKQPEVVLETLEPVEEDTEEVTPDPVVTSPKVEATSSVVFVTPYTEVEILASEVFIDKTVFSIISPLNDRVKVKPQRGSELKAIFNGETYDLYASGVYIPIKSLDSVLSIFFVMDETKEEG